MIEKKRRCAAFAVCGSFCTLEAALDAARALRGQGWELLPVMSFAAGQDTRFGRASGWRHQLEGLTGRPVLDTLQAVEPLGPRHLADALVIAPCTGATLARLAEGLSDTPVTLAAKSLLRVGCPVVIAVSTNDGLGASGENIARLYQRKHYYFVPYGQDEEAVQYVAEQLRGMKAFIEAETGEKIDEGKLAKAVGRSQRSMDNFRRFMALSANKQQMATVTDQMFSAFMLHNLLGTEVAERFTVQCLKTVKNAPAAKGKRLLWMHTIPYWVAPLREVLDYNEAVQVVGCDMSFEGLIQGDTADPYRAMAQRVVYSAFNGPVQRRIDRGLEAARELKADGVIWFCHWGCKHTLGGAQIAKQKFEAAGYPGLIRDGDGCGRRHGGEGQMATRVEAFIEMLGGEQV